MHVGHVPIKKAHRDVVHEARLEHVMRRVQENVKRLSLEAKQLHLARKLSFTTEEFNECPPACRLSICS